MTTDLTVDPIPMGVLIMCGQHRLMVPKPDGVTRKERRAKARAEAKAQGEGR